MGHYAFTNENNIVVEVITGRNETVTEDGVYWEIYYGRMKGLRCLRTSYHGNIRKQYAGLGYTFDEDSDVFIAPQPYPSWILDAEYDWVAPIPYPTDGGVYVWDEKTQSWVLVS